ncbi:hypothetical protein ANANG_G00128230 [Anguilla anguilla]|uniref:Uncharacterized protein n=1 Tax=Anguilla anguilla TaxID=7936 RepID=A0A9D3RY78_ANGAN|nr:hypothetical protein ANANG_G00128230 [Anguilla anguilla]
MIFQAQGAGAWREDCGPFPRSSPSTPLSARRDGRESRRETAGRPHQQLHLKGSPAGARRPPRTERLTRTPCQSRAEQKMKSDGLGGPGQTANAGKPACNKPGEGEAAVAKNAKDKAKAAKPGERGTPSKTRTVVRDKPEVNGVAKAEAPGPQRENGGAGGVANGIRGSPRQGPEARHRHQAQSPGRQRGPAQTRQASEAAREGPRPGPESAGAHLPSAPPPPGAPRPKTAPAAPAAPPQV